MAGTLVPSCIALSRGALSTRPGRDHIGKSSCLTGGTCFQFLLCFCTALAGRPPQPFCSCRGGRCTCINFAVVEDSLAELDLYPPPCLFGMLGICKAVSTFFDCLSRSAGPSKRKNNVGITLVTFWNDFEVSLGCARPVLGHFGVTSRSLWYQSESHR